MAANWGGSNPPQLLLVQTWEGRPLPVLFQCVGGRAAGAKGALTIFFNFSSCLTRCRREGEGSAPPSCFNTTRGGQPSPSHFDVTRGGLSPSPPVPFLRNTGRVNSFPSHWTWHMGSF